MFCCFDTEDDSPELREAGKSMFDKKCTQIASISDEGEKFYNRGNVQQFKEHVRRSKHQFWYAHNLQYDLGNLFADHLDELDLVLVKGRLIKARWKDKVFIDSFNMWPMGAAKLGEKFGLQKRVMDVRSKDYVFMDVEIIRQAMLFAWKFAARFEIEQLPTTLGGLATKLWEQWGGANTPESSQLSRQALFGGRVELFKVRNDTSRVFWTDINSLYPHVMTRLFPGTMEPWDDLPEFGVATVQIQQPETDLPILPVRDADSRILYPWGKFYGTWTIAEIRVAVEHGAKILQVLDVLGTNEGVRPYKGYMDKIYALRQGSNSEAENEFLKRLMCNLYGRLSLTGQITRSVLNTERTQHRGMPYGRKVLVDYFQPLDESVNWSHGAYVSSYGRLELFRYLKMIGAKNLIYCDTDSTIFDGSNGIPFPCGRDLGQMKIIKRCSVCGIQWSEDHAAKKCKGSHGIEHWRDCETYAPKMYRANKLFRAKGVPVKRAQEFIEKGSTVFDLPFKLRESIRFYDRENSHKLSVWHEVEKVRGSGYDRKEQIKNRYYPCKVRMV